MPYLGQSPSKGDENNFKILDDISSYTLTFDGSDSSVVSAANDTITSLTHRFVQGQRVTYTDGGGDEINGLSSNGVYFIIKEDHNTIKLATSASNASNGVAVNITNVGSGSSHTLNVAFDGVNTKFKATHTTGQKAKITRSAQLVISMNGVIQQPHDTATPSTGFGFDLDGTIVFSQAPVSSDVFWAHVLTNNNVTFDISDNDIDNFTGDGSTVSFNLSKSPPDNRNILVTVDGVVQYPNDPDGTERSYTVVENVLTFSVAPALGTEVQVRHIGFAGSSSGSGSGGVTSFYGRTGAVVLKSTDNIVANNATFSGDLTVNGTTTTLDTQLVEVDKIEVETGGSNVGVAVTHNGSGDLIRLYDGSTQVVTVADDGTVGIGSAIPLSAMALDIVGSIRYSNQSRGASGSASEPSYAFYADHDSGMYRSSTNQISFATGGSERLKIDSDGNLNVNYDLDVTGNAGIGSLSVTGVSTFTDNITFGVTASSTAITSGTIKQVSLGKDYWNGDKGHYGALRLLVYDNGLNDAYGLGISNGELEIQSQGGIGLYAGSGASDSKRDRRMYIDNTGDVLFGYNTAGAVNSSNLLNMSLGGTYHNTNGAMPKLSLWHDGTDHMGFGVSPNQLDYILTSSVYDHVFYGGNAGTDELLRIKGDTGNVGIGSEIPQALFVVSNAGANGFEFNPNFNSNNSIIASYNRTGGGSYSQLTLSASQHIFAQGGTEYGRFNTSGNLGIGTDNPLYPLHVKGDTTNTAPNATGILMGLQHEHAVIHLNAADTKGSLIDFSIPGQDRRGGIIYYHSNNPTTADRDSMLFYTAGQNERLRIDSNGMIGIGVTPETQNTFNAIEIGKTGFLGSQTGARTIEIASNAYYNSGWKYKENDVASLYYQYQGYHSFASAGTGSADGAITFDEHLRIAADGKVGIGTDNPYYNLEVNFNNSNTALSGGSAGNWGGAGLRLENENNTVGSMSLIHFRTGNHADWHIGGKFVGNNASDFVFIHEGTEEALRITTGGEVGINTTVVPYGNFAVDHGQYGLTRISEYSHLLLQNKNAGTTEFWTLAPRDNGRFGIGRGTPASAGQISDEKFTILSDGKVGINQDTPTAKLHVIAPYDELGAKVGAGGTGYSNALEVYNAGGALQFAVNTNDIKLGIGNRTLYYQRNLAAAINSTTEIVRFTRTHGAHSMRVSIVCSSSGFSVAKVYEITTSYNQTSAGWRVVRPISSTGRYDANFELLINVTNTQTDLKLRKIDYATYGGNCDISINYTGSYSQAVTITNKNATGTDTTAYDVFEEGFGLYDVNNGQTALTLPKYHPSFLVHPVNDAETADGFVTYTSVTYNNGSHYKTTGGNAGKFIAPVFGRYFFAANYVAGAACENCFVRFYINGALNNKGNHYSGGGNAWGSGSPYMSADLSGTCIQLAEGDYVQLHLTGTNGGGSGQAGYMRYFGYLVG